MLRKKIGFVLVSGVRALGIGSVLVSGVRALGIGSVLGSGARALGIGSVLGSGARALGIGSVLGSGARALGIGSVLGLLSLLFFFSACEREEKSSSVNVVVRDQVYGLMRDIYFWAEHARNQSTDVSVYDGSTLKLEEMIEALRSPDDRFTFILDREDASAFRGEATDVGLLIRYLGDTAWIAFVEPSSVADQAGLRRGMWIQSVGLDEEEGTRELVLTPAAEFNGNQGYIKQLQPTDRGSQRPRSLQITHKAVFRVAQRGEGAESLKQVELTAMLYSIVGLSHSKVIEVEGQKVGYIHMSTFLDPQNRTREALSVAFDNFRQQSVRSLVVDFRYNGGGHVSLAAHLLNLLYNPGQKEIMFSYAHNEAYAPARDQKVYFSESTTALNPSRLYFLVDAKTASASELVINSMKPFGDVSVYLIGHRSLGKNVGSYTFFLPDQDNYTHLFAPISFFIFNKESRADYAGGFVPDYEVFDGLYYELGDTREAMLGAALHHVVHGSFPVSDVVARHLSTSPQPFVSTRHIDQLDVGLIAEQ